MYIQHRHIYKAMYNVLIYSHALDELTTAIVAIKYNNMPPT